MIEFTRLCFTYVEDQSSFVGMGLISPAKNGEHYKSRVLSGVEGYPKQYNRTEPYVRGPWAELDTRFLIFCISSSTQMSEVRESCRVGTGRNLVSWSGSQCANTGAWTQTRPIKRISLYSLCHLVLQLTFSDVNRNFFMSLCSCMNIQCDDRLKRKQTINALAGDMGIICAKRLIRFEERSRLFYR